MFFKILVAKMIPCHSFFTADGYPALILNWLPIVLHCSQCRIQTFFGHIAHFLEVKDCIF